MSRKIAHNRSVPSEILPMDKNSGIVPRLPLEWTATTLRLAGTTHDAGHCAPVLIFPNPLNPRRYVVVNSGVTFREEALLNNANQIPKLPDWAILDITQPPNAESAGKVVAADFFKEAGPLVGLK